MNLNVTEWFASKLILDSIQKYSVDGVDFMIMALTKNLKEDVELCDTSEGMLSLAARSGLSYEGGRLIDNEHAVKYMDEFWIKNECVDPDPSVEHSVGKMVCEISGLSSVLSEMLADEEQRRVDAVKTKGNIDGDSELPDISIDQLNEDVAA